MAAAWDYKKFGTAGDPLRQSDLGLLASGYSCPKKFAMQKEEDAGGGRTKSNVSGSAALGTAVHETFRRILTRATTSVLEGRTLQPEHVRAVIREELVRASEGLPIAWYDDDENEEIEDAVHMVIGGVAELGRRVHSFVLVEAPFRLEMTRNGKTYFVTGTIDVAYHPKSDPSKIVLVDWKTGQQLMSQPVLDHGYQFGLYAEALARGVFYAGEEGERTIGLYPDEIYVGHLRDFVPYARGGSKSPKRPEQLAMYGIVKGQKVKYAKGEMRGPGWYRSNRREENRARLFVSVHTLVGTVRLGRFIEHIDEHCTKCPYASRCLNEGYVDADEEKALAKLVGNGEVFTGLEEAS